MTTELQYFWRKPAARLAVAALLALAASGPAVQAQTQSAPNFWLQLFGGGAKPTPPPAPAPVQTRAAPQVQAAPRHVVLRKPKPRDFVPATATRAAGTPGGAPVEAAFFIDVIGDSLGVLAADGLKQAYVNKPEVAVVDKARESSGLVREDYYSWPKAAEDLVDPKNRLDFVVIEIGINDLQALKDGADTLDPLSERWSAIYGQRIEALAEIFHAHHVPVAWIGLPPMRSDSFNASAVKLNQLYKLHVEKAEARYIDIWDAFANQSGQYDAYGPDINGQNVKLRGIDGIHFTKAGSRKVAQFLEADIRKVMEKAKPQTDVASLPPDIEQAAVDINAQIRREMGAPAPPSAAPAEPVKPLAGPILPLTDRPLSPGGTLATRSADPSRPDSLAARVLRQGETAPARLGRADDFTWPRL